MVSDEDITCSVEDGEVKCYIEDVGEVEMKDGHREVFEKQFGNVASLETCAHGSEFYLQENDFERPEINPDQDAVAKLLFIRGCPIPDMTSEEPIE